MPEMPEVETVRRTLFGLVLHKKIRDVDVYHEKMIRNTTVDELKNRIVGKTITDIKRYAKQLMFQLEDVYLFSHLRMEGKYFIKHLEEPRNKHEHVIFYFTDGSTLRYHDTRKFGTFDVIENENIWTNSPLTKLGPEIGSDNLTVPYLYKKLHSKTVAIKGALLDQTILSGLGNIYVDEVLYDTRIHPETSCRTLTKKDVMRIIESSNKVIQKAIDLGGSSIRSYTSTLGVTGRFQNELQVHTRESELCNICSTAIHKIKVVGRGTYYCPTCQTKSQQKRNQSFQS